MICLRLLSTPVASSASKEILHRADRDEGGERRSWKHSQKQITQFVARDAEGVCSRPLGGTTMVWAFQAAANSPVGAKKMSKLQARSHRMLGWERETSSPTVIQGR